MAYSVETVSQEVQSGLDQNTLNLECVKKLFGIFGHLQQCLRQGLDRCTDVMKCCHLYMGIQDAVDQSPCCLQGVQRSFEYYLIETIVYVVDCLNFKTNLRDFHCVLLQTIKKLLVKTTLSTKETLMNSYKDIVVAIWRPLCGIGDIYVRRLAIEVIIVLMKDADKYKMKQEIDKLGTIDKWGRHVLLELSEIPLKQANKNVLQRFLLSYYVRAKVYGLIFTFRCKTMILGGVFEFIKPQNSEEFWIDIYKSRSKECHIFCHIRFLHNVKCIIMDAVIDTMILVKDMLTLSFLKPVQFLGQCQIGINVEEINALRCLKISLEPREVQRIQESFIIEVCSQADQIQQRNFKDLNGIKVEKDKGLPSNLVTRHGTFSDVQKHYISRVKNPMGPLLTKQNENRNNRSIGGSISALKKPLKRPWHYNCIVEDNNEECEPNGSEDKICAKIAKFEMKKSRFI